MALWLLPANDPRRPRLLAHFALALIWKIYTGLVDYAELNAAERLFKDPAFRLIGLQQIWERGGFDLPLAAAREELLAEEKTSPVWPHSIGS